jgi:hypothetical protein
LISKKEELVVRKFVYLLVGVIAASAVTLFAQENAGKASEGTLIVSQKTYPLRHVFAYEATLGGDEEIAVVLSGQTVSNEQLEKARGEEKEGYDGRFNEPFLRLIFDKSGKLHRWSAQAGGTTLSKGNRGTTGEIKLQDGRVSGQASLPTEAEGMFPSGFNAHFDVPLVKAGEALPESTSKKPGPAANVKPAVSGIFKGNGKEAKLAYVSARWGEPFDGKPGIVLVFSEKDHTKDKKPDFNASFGKFGSALVISLHEDGSIYGCEVVHAALQKKNFSSIGGVEATDFAYENGKVEGRLTTNGPKTFFDETWEIDLKFVAPLGAIPKELQPAETEKSAKGNTSARSDETSALTESDDESASPPEEAKIRAKDLAITKDATDVQYQSVTGGILFKSKLDVRTACAELASNLKAQGWSTSGMDMVQPTSSILRRKRGAATLTIFVKPASGGSEVKMFTEGLAWE